MEYSWQSSAYNLMEYFLHWKITMRHENKRYVLSLICFLPLIINYIIIFWGFLLLQISAITSPNMMNIFLVVFELCSSRFSWIKFKSLKYLIKGLKLLKYFKPGLSRWLVNKWNFALQGSFVYRHILSIPCWWLIKLSNVFAFLMQSH